MWHAWAENVARITKKANGRASQKEHFIKAADPQTDFAEGLRKNG